MSPFWGFTDFFFIAKKFINVGNADSRTDTFDSDVIATPQHVFEQANLMLVGWSKIRVPTFRAVRHVLRAIPGEKRFTQSSSRGDDGNRPMVINPAAVQREASNRAG